METRYKLFSTNNLVSKWLIGPEKTYFQNKFSFLGNFSRLIRYLAPPPEINRSLCGDVT